MTSNRPPAVFAALALVVVVGVSGWSCSWAEAPSHAAARAERFSVMTWNLDLYDLVASPVDPDAPPVAPSQTDDIVAAVRSLSPDVIAFQGLGSPAAWTELQFRLRDIKPEYRYNEYLATEGAPARHMGVLSRFPIVARVALVQDRYTIGPTQFPVLRGFLQLDIEPNPDYRFRMLVAHFKSKRFHEYGQAEMRRNEARLLCNHIRASLSQQPDINLIVMGDFNDEPGSRVLREVMTYQDQPILYDLRPADAQGDAWTRRSEADHHLRTSYMLVGRGMLPEVVLDATGILHTPLAHSASPHRPLLATFSQIEKPAAEAPDLSGRSAPEYADYD